MQVEGLKILKCPEEGGTMKQFEDFKETIGNHVSIAWQGGNDLAHCLDKEMDPPIFTAPPDIDEATATRLEKREWETLADVYIISKKVLDTNKKSLYSLIAQSLSKLVKGKLQTMEGYKGAETKKDVMWLMAGLDDIMSNFEQNRHPVLAVDDLNEKIMRMKQKEEETNKDFVKSMLREMKQLERHTGGVGLLWGKSQQKELEEQIDFFETKFLVPDNGYEEEQLSEDIKIAKKKLADKTKAMIIFKRLDKKRYGNLQNDRHNSYLCGKDEYPTNVPELLKLIDNYKEWGGNKNRPQQRQRTQPRTNATSLLQSGNPQIKFLRGKI